MKVCKFCGTENKDSAVSCISCNGNVFSNKCANCGNVFDDGNFCPNCGVKAGTKPKKCPDCGTEYFSAACPDCGYIKKNTGVNTSTSSSQPVRKRKTWLWVLGWICMFPVPLTILIARNEKMNKFLKFLIILLAWTLYIGIAMDENPEDSKSVTVGSAPAVYQTVAPEVTSLPDSNPDSPLQK